MKNKKRFNHIKTFESFSVNEGIGDLMKKTKIKL